MIFFGKIKIGCYFVKRSEDAIFCLGIFLGNIFGPILTFWFGFFSFNITFSKISKLEKMKPKEIVERRY